MLQSFAFPVPDLTGATRERALNALVAVRVFGKYVERTMVPSRDGSGIWPAFNEILDERGTRLPVLHYATDVRAAMDVVVEMTARGFGPVMVETIEGVVLAPEPLTSQRVATAICEKAIELVAIGSAPDGPDGQKTAP